MGLEKLEVLFERMISFVLSLTIHFAELDTISVSRKRIEYMENGHSRRYKAIAKSSVMP